MTSKNMPVFPTCPTPIAWQLEFCREADTVVYFFKGMPVFSHHATEIVNFFMITAQFCVMGHAEQADIVRAFAVEAEGVRLAVELYRNMGAEGFYPERTQTQSKPQAAVKMPFFPEGVKHVNNLLAFSKKEGQCAQQLEYALNQST